MPQRIVADPDTLAGKPRLEGTRISVEFLLEVLAGGASRQDILGNRSAPQLRSRPSRGIHRA